MFPRRLAFLIAAFALALAACARATPTPAPTATAAPVTVTDDEGTVATFKAVPQRIVSLAPSNTEVLFALGLGDRVVGVTDLDNYPEAAKAKPKVGGFKANLEQILAQQPDLVLAISGDTQLHAQLRTQGIPVIVLQPEDIPGILHDIALVGKATGADAQAAALTRQMEAKLTEIDQKVKDAARPRVFLEIDGTDPTKPWTSGPGSFIHTLIGLAGGENVAGKLGSPWGQFSLEELVRSDPDIIILADTKYGTTVESVKARTAWAGLAAVKKGAIYGIDDDLISRPGPRIVQGLEELARIIHPEFFR